ncbi:TBC1 domain family member 20-like [Dysidea avara]|uniref:TBC1 domain family member 20-like n=1 Tax=Dysidea avara TaxID=196820 RepID=UPI003321F11F
MSDPPLDRALHENDIAALKRLAFSPGGYGNNEVRQKVWPVLIATDSSLKLLGNNDPSLRSHRDKGQVMLDVDRCVRRLPAEIPLIRRRRYQQQILNIILQLLIHHPDIHYYQGLHDIVLTFVLAVGDKVAYAVMDMLVEHHLRDFLDANMTRTRLYISFLKPLLTLLDPDLEEFITRSQCYYFFSLSWVITWFGHVIQDNDIVMRLADAFLASHPLMPLYLSAMLVVSRRDEVLSLECEMSCVHSFLSNIPEDLNYEKLLTQAWDTFQKFPPEKVAKLGSISMSSSITLMNYPRLLRQVEGTMLPVDYWMWVGLGAIAAAALAVMYHYMTSTK